MKLYKVTVSIRGCKLESIVKAGVVATAEVAYEIDGVLTPRHRVNVMLNETDRGPAAWIQLLRFDQSKKWFITHEGWAKGEVSSFDSKIAENSENITIVEVDSPTAKMLQSQEKLTFGTLTCCTASGTSPQGYDCTVTCCNACCSISDCTATCCA